MTADSYPLKVGTRSEFAKTISESDIYLFAGITGDFAPVHINESAMKRTPFGGRIAHGVLIMGLMSTTVSLVIQKATSTEKTGVSLGFDRVRFVKPVFIGDTVTVTYEVSEVMPEQARSLGQVQAVNQAGEVVSVAEHIMKWV